MTGEQIQKYTRKISDANATQIIVIVYEILETYIDDAIGAYNEKDFGAFSNNLKKACKCVSDLEEALDMQYEISANLLDIYLFVNKELSIASVTRDVETVSRIKTFITKLKKSFEELAKQDTSAPVMGNTQEVYAGLTYGKGTLTESTSMESNRGFTV